MDNKVFHYDGSSLSSVINDGLISEGEGQRVSKS